MPDYFTQTVVQPAIPVADMTPLEQLLLTHVFQAKPQGESLYLFADEEPSATLWLDRGSVEAALARSEAPPWNWANGAIRHLLSELPADDAEIEFVISNGWQYILNDIVRRSPTLRYVTVISSFTCSRMLPDGFGGEAVLITADNVFSKNTHDVITDFLAQIDPAEANTRPLVLMRPRLRFPLETEKADPRAY